MLKSLGRKLAKVAVCLFVLVLLAWFTVPVWAPWMGEFLVQTDPPAPADMILVLGGDWRGTRILTAAELAWQGYAPAVMVSGAGDLYGVHESDLAVNFAHQHGFDEKLFIKFRYPALSTREELRALIAELRRRHLRRVLMVTSTFHTRRAGAIFRQEAPDMECHVIASPDRYFDPKTWWKDREGRKTFYAEWTKTIANFFRL